MRQIKMSLSLAQINLNFLINLSKSNLTQSKSNIQEQNRSIGYIHNISILMLCIVKLYNKITLNLKLSYNILYIIPNK